MSQHQVSAAHGHGYTLKMPGHAPLLGHDQALGQISVIDKPIDWVSGGSLSAVPGAE